MKEFLIKILPGGFITFLMRIMSFPRKIKLLFQLRREYLNDMSQYVRFSRTFENNTPQKLLGSIILQYHVIEKGLTMPEIRAGFGTERVKALCNDCIKYIREYGQENQQLEHAIEVILEYEDYNSKIGVAKEAQDKIDQLKKQLVKPVLKSTQNVVTRQKYFEHAKSEFSVFARSRHSIRNFSDEVIPDSLINKSLELAQCAPSACNRQSWRTYIYSEKRLINKILELQGGNRGFGHLTDKLIIITGDLSAFCNINERNQVYVDGGIYVMNVLYALHSYEIAACVLNCGFDNNKAGDIKQIAGIDKSHVFIAMIICGKAPDEFKTAISPRNGLGENIIIKN